MKELDYHHFIISNKLMNLCIGNQRLNIVRRETTSYMFSDGKLQNCLYLQRCPPKSEKPVNPAVNVNQRRRQRPVKTCREPTI